jgi:hypothetical protein
MHVVGENPDVSVRDSTEGGDPTWGKVYEVASGSSGPSLKEKDGVQCPAGTH